MRKKLRESDDNEKFLVQTGYNAATQQVMMDFKHTVTVVVFTAKQARAIGAHLMDLADAAENKNHGQNQKKVRHLA